MNLLRVLKSAARTSLSFLLRATLLRRRTLFLYNYLFERAPRSLSQLLVRLQRQPKFDLSWTIYLRNGRKIVVPVAAGDLRAWEFVHAYQWHDVGLRNIEPLLHGYYDLKYHYLDIGANMGIRSLLPLSMGRSCVLFEPNIRISEFTRRIFELNDLATYVIEPICLSDHLGASAFYVSPSSYMSSLDREHALREGEVIEIVVPTKTLDAYLDEKSGIVPKVIKIDVEGAEYAVLRGAEASLARFSPVLLIEILDGHPTRHSVLDFLMDRGYLCFGIWDTENLALTKLEAQTFDAFDGSWNYLFTQDVDLVAALRPYLRES